MSGGWITFVNDYGGLLVGVALLLLAVSVLPGRTKWYVLTVGLAILGYEAYTRTVNRKLLREADAERERLRGELAQLEGRRQELEATVSGLNQRMAELNARTAELAQRKAALEQEGGNLAARKQALDSETEQLVVESQALVQQAGNSEAILAKLAAAQDAIHQMEKIAH